MHMVNKIVIRAGKCARLCESSYRKLHNELLGQKRTMMLVELSCRRIGSVLIIDSVPKDTLEAMSSLRQKLDDYCTRAVGLRTCSDDPAPLKVLPTQPMSKEITFSINYWPLLQLAAAMSARSIATHVKGNYLFDQLLAFAAIGGGNVRQKHRGGASLGDLPSAALSGTFAG
eukprot:s392_g3.t1